jgi:hypothetical protein
LRRPKHSIIELAEPEEEEEEEEEEGGGGGPYLKS